MPATNELPVDEIKGWKINCLFDWIQESLINPLDDQDKELFFKAKFDGAVFLEGAGKNAFFQGAGLSFGASVRLAGLAKETIGQKSLETRKRKSHPHANTPPSPKRTRIGDSSLIVNGKLSHFRSGATSFQELLQREGQAYFDRTRYISKIDELDKNILFCRPRRFGKSLTLGMLKHFHGLQYVHEHQSLYKDLDVQKDIDKRKVEPGQYFVLKFDFSEINPSPDLTRADETLVHSLNSSLEAFYERYTAYLGGNFADIYQNIDTKPPNVVLRKCARLVKRAIRRDEQLAGIEGIYVLVDEYDAFSNNYLQPPKSVGGPKIVWEDTEVGRTFKSFWATIKALGAEGIIRRIFITGISPLSLSGLGSAFNVTRNLSFDRDLAGLCGLTLTDLEDALKGSTRTLEPAMVFFQK